MIFIFHNDYLSHVSLVFSKDTVTLVAPNDDATPCLQIFAPDIQEAQNTLSSPVQLLPFPILLSQRHLQLSFLTGDVVIKRKLYQWEVWAWGMMGGVCQKEGYLSL
jgi:hypothetical protein